MVTFAAATLIMEYALKKAAQYVSLEGYIFPLIYLMHKGKPIVVDIDHEGIMDNQSEAFDGDKNKVYKTVLSVKIDKENGIDIIMSLCAKLARVYKPDAISIIVPCWYNEYHDEPYNDRYIGDDPDAIKILHALIYCKGEEDPVMKLVPYLDRGVVKTGISEQKKRDIIFVDTPWSRNFKRVRPYIKNPYTYVGA